MDKRESSQPVAECLECAYYDRERANTTDDPDACWGRLRADHPCHTRDKQLAFKPKETI